MFTPSKVGEAGAVKFFQGRARAFSASMNDWVSLNAKEVSIQVIPETGPCLFIHHSHDDYNVTYFKLKDRIKAKSTGKPETLAWVLKATRMHLGKPQEDQIIAVRFSQEKRARNFKEAFDIAFQEADKNVTSWDCQVCTFSNMSEDEACIMCNTTRPSEAIWDSDEDTLIDSEMTRKSRITVCSDFEGPRLRPSINAEASSLEIVNEGESKNVWSCGWCSYENTSDRHICEMCNKSKVSENTWSCQVCTFINKITSEKCEICEFKRESTEENVVQHLDSFVQLINPLHRRLQEAADYIYSRHPDGKKVFETLLTISTNLYNREERYRELWVDTSTVRERLLSYDGALDFLKLLGFKLDDRQVKFICDISDPEDSLLDKAVEVLKGILKNFEVPNQPKTSKRSQNRPNVRSIGKIPPPPTEKKEDGLGSSCIGKSQSHKLAIPFCGSIKLNESSLESKASEDYSRRTRFSRTSSTGETPGLTMREVSNLGNEEGNIDQWFEEDEQKEEGESLHNLVFWLTKEKEKKGKEVLLLVHRTFSTSENLLKALSNRFREAENQEQGNELKLSVMQFCHHWVTKFFEDLESQQKFNSDFIEFLRFAKGDKQCRKFAKQILERLNDKWDEKNCESQITILPKYNPLKSTQKTILTFHTKDIAEVLTLLDFDKFKKIKHRELLNQAWKKKDREQRAPNVLNMIAQYNRVCKWAQMTVLSASGLDQRQKTVTWFIKLAIQLIEMKNYNTSWAVNGALNSTHIYNLKDTWAGVKKKYRENFASQTKLFNAAGNYRLLRQSLEKLKPPAIPQLGVMLKDLVFIDDGFLLMKNETGSKVNFRKCIKFFERIEEGFGRFQTQNYEFKRNDRVLSWLQNSQDSFAAFEDKSIQNLSDRVKASDAEKSSWFFRKGSKA